MITFNTHVICFSAKPLDTGSFCSITINLLKGGYAILCHYILVVEDRVQSLTPAARLLHLMLWFFKAIDFPGDSFSSGKPVRSELMARLRSEHQVVSEHPPL